jgi:hypothetical protein
VALVTLKNSLAEVGSSTQYLDLEIEEDGLVVADFGKLPWAGSELTIEPRPPAGCTLRMITATGGRSSFFVKAECFGGNEGIEIFVGWLQRGATHAGASVHIPASAA